MFTYQLHWADGSDAGEADYAVVVQEGEIVWALNGSKLRVLDLVLVEDEESPYTGLLRVEAA